jgi:hypothetical protein
MKQTLILDSSQIDTFLGCPTQWNLSYRENRTLQDMNEKEAIAYGTLGHKWLELYYHQKAIGRPLGDCVDTANKLDPDTMDAAPEDNHRYPLDDPQRKFLKQRLQEYWMTYSTNDYIPDYTCELAISISSKGFPVDNYIRKPLIEQGFSYKLLETKEYLFILEGRIDFIGTHNNTPFFMDHKFQMRERKLYPKSIQFKNYAMVTGMNMGIINYVRLHKAVNSSTFVREPISFGSYEIKRWRSELINIYVDIAREVKGEAFTHRWSSCSGKYGYPCEFTHVCEEPNIATANLIKISNYKIKKEWRPW